MWAAVRGDPVFMRRVNGWLALFWIAMIPVSIITHWISSVAYVAALSLWALVSGHWSAWQSSPRRGQPGAGDGGAATFRNNACLGRSSNGS